MKKKEILELIESLKISKDEFTILSSAALVLREIYSEANDLDIAVTQKGFEQLNSNYNLIKKNNDWYIVNDKVECIIDDMEEKREKIDNYYVQDIYDYLKFIESSDRDKDKMRVSLVKNYISNRKK